MLLISQEVLDPTVVVVVTTQQQEQLIKEILGALDLGHLAVTFCHIDFPEEALKLIREGLVKFRKVQAVVWTGETKSWIRLDSVKTLASGSASWTFIPCPSVLEISDPAQRDLFVLAFLSVKGLVEKFFEGGTQYVHLQTEREIESFLRDAPRMSRRWAFDIESSKFAPYHKDFFLISIAFSHTPGEAYGFGLTHPQARMRFWRRNYWLWQKLREFMMDRRIRWVGHNILKFDKPGVEIGLDCSMVDSYQDFWDRFDDTMIMKYTLHESAKGRYNLASCAQEELQWGNWKIDVDDLTQVPLGDVVKYNCKDADATIQIAAAFERKMRDFSEAYSVDLSDLYRRIHLPNAINAAMMDGNGIRCNEGYARDLQKKYDTIIEQLSLWLRAQEPVKKLEALKTEEVLAGRKRIPAPGTDLYRAFKERLDRMVAFNPTGTKDCSRLLWEVMQIPYPEQFGRTAKKGEPRITAEVLEFLAGQGHQVCKALHKIAELSDSLSSYVRPILVNTTRTRDGLSHPSFYPPGTETGRYSCKNADENAGVGGVGENIQKINRAREIKDLYCSRYS